MKIEDKRKCKNMEEIGEMDFGTVFKNAGTYYVITDDGLNYGDDFNQDCDTVLCVNLENGCLSRFKVEDRFEKVKAKVVIE